MQDIRKISIDEFKKVELRVGVILSAERVPETDKLLRLSVDLGEAEPRQIVSGIAEYFPEPEELVGKQAVFATNLAPREVRGLESNGMIIACLRAGTHRQAARADDNQFSLIVPEADMPPGTLLG